MSAYLEIDWTKVAVFGECTTSPDPDGRFLVVVMRDGRVHSWPSAQCEQSVAPLVERATGAKVEYAGHFGMLPASRVMFPVGLVDQPLLDFCPVPGKGRVAWTMEPFREHEVLTHGIGLSDEVEAYLQALAPGQVLAHSAPLKSGEVSLRAYLAIVACAHELPVLVECVSKGRLDEMEVVIALEMLLERVCMAWNSRRLNPEAVDEMTEEQYAALTDGVPPLIPGLRLQPTLWGEELFDPKEPCAYVRRRWYLPWTWDVRRNQTLPMLDELRLAAVAASRLKARTAWPDEELRTALAEILRHLNLAWHFRWRSEAAVGRLTSTQKENLGRTIPGFFMLGSKRLETEG